MKLRASFDGKANYDTWHVDEWNDVGEPSMVIERHSRTLSVTFESHREKERFINGVHLCRAKYHDGDVVRDIYLTGC